MNYPIIALLRGSHGLSARRARRTKSSRPEGPKAGPKGRQLEVGARRAPRPQVIIIIMDIFQWGSSPRLHPFEAEVLQTDFGRVSSLKECGESLICLGLGLSGRSHPPSLAPCCQFSSGSTVARTLFHPLAPANSPLFHIHIHRLWQIKTDALGIKIDEILDNSI